MSLSASTVELSILVLTVVEVILVAGILVWDIISQRRSLEIARRSHDMYADFFRERTRWYAARGKPKSPESSDLMVQGGEGNGVGRTLQPDGDDRGQPELAIAVEVASEESEERAESGSENK